MTRSTVLLTLALSSPAAALFAQATPTPTPTPEGGVKRQEIVVVSASKQEEELGNAPVTMSVISNESLLTSHAQNYADLLREIPGVNAIQMSARDVNITSRQATQSLANTQLGLLDGRTIYLDLFGLIVWDFVPISPVDVKQIEVVRGPASAVWGANAFTGAVNIITKTPRESVGTSASFTGGLLNRDAENSTNEGVGSSYGGSVSLSRAPSEHVAFRLTGGYVHSDNFARPVGTVPRGTNPAFPDQSSPDAQTGGATYPTYQNKGTDQPKVDLRVDQDFSGGARISYSAGYGGTSGMIHTGIGPFEMKNGSYMSYGRVGFSKGNFRLTAFTNLLDVDAPNRVFNDPVTHESIQGIFKTQTYDLEVGNSHLIGSHHILSYGGNARHNNFDVSISDDGDGDPTKSPRDEFGGYVQDEVYYGKFRFTLGARVDKFSSVDDPSFSPRLAAVFKPAVDHTIRASFNRAFRSPSVINNFLFVRTVQPVDLSALAPLLPAPARPLVAQPFPLIVQVVGNKDLKVEEMTAFEVGYTGTFVGKVTVSVAAYMNDLDNNINFVNLPFSEDRYTGANPPPGWQLGGPIIELLASQGRFLPRTIATYKNLGPIRNRGVETSVDYAVSKSVRMFANYSWQDDPKPLKSDNPYPPEEISAPPTNRYNVGVSFRESKVFGSLSANHSDKAFWPDVLTREYHGTTKGYTMFNGTLGVKWNEHVTLSVKGTNLLNEDIQQHIFGDILKRNVVGELRLTF
jgi:iron complex outermembrane receptor protein